MAIGVRTGVPPEKSKPAKSKAAPKAGKDEARERPEAGREHEGEHEHEPERSEHGHRGRGKHG